MARTYAHRRELITSGARLGDVLHTYPALKDAAEVSASLWHSSFTLSVNLFMIIYGNHAEKHRTVELYVFRRGVNITDSVVVFLGCQVVCTGGYGYFVFRFFSNSVTAILISFSPSIEGPRMDVISKFRQWEMLITRKKWV